MANPWRRLLARIVDQIILLPVWATAFVLLLGGQQVHTVSPGVQLSPTTFGPGGQPYVPVAYLLMGAMVAISGFLYEGICNQLWGRTPGKVLMRVRAVLVRDGEYVPLDRGAGWLRSATYWGFASVELLGFLDAIWCLGASRQCLHDKVVGTVVIMD